MWSQRVGHDRATKHSTAEVLNGTTDHLDLVYIFRTVRSKKKKKQCTVFQSMHGTFSRIDHIPGYKTSLNNLII